jgi:ATP-dependent DNA helicase RecG
MASRGQSPSGVARGGSGARRGAVKAAAPIGPITPDTPIGRTSFTGNTVLRRVGPRIGVRTVRDLLFYLPRRYDDLRALSTARELNRIPEGEPASARLQVHGLRVEQTFRRRVQRTTAYLGDDTGEVEATWFGRRFVERRLHDGDWIVVSGKIRRRGFTTSFDNPEFQPDDGSALLHAGRIVPAYRLTASLTAATLRRAIRQALDAVGREYADYLAADVLAAAGESVGIAAALENAHYPETFPARDAALRRLGFDELLALEVGMVVRDRQRRVAVGEAVAVSAEQISRGIAAVETALTEQLRARTGTDVAAQLTGDQAAAVEAIAADLGRPRPMMRLLQGDVGSGKTAVAALALAFVADAGRQGALLAPTDLLARQHAAALRRLVEPLGHSVTLLTGSLPAAEKRAALELLAAPSADQGLMGLSSGRIVVGTHALVQEAVRFADLALAVVDEQHRFGVAQREALGAKGVAPHMLLMTATPIPRTLGQILLADMDVSDLRALPAGRQRILTGIRHTDELPGARNEPGHGAYPLIVKEVAAGHRAFVVVPLVEEDEESAARSADEVATALPGELAEAARRMAVATPVPRVGVVHGQMKAAERDARMDLFRRGEIDVMVGTTVLEVGVDVPEATVMLILDADRFGLAQLHQLRGRVGRGEAQSYCILVSDSTDATARARLDALVSHTDGFELAELDLELRQEGELLGLHQSGLPTLRIASLRDPEDRRRALRAREIAETLVDEGGALRPGNERLAAELRQGWLARVGAGEVLAETGEVLTEEAEVIAEAGDRMAAGRGIKRG